MNQVNIVFNKVLAGIVEVCNNSSGSENLMVVIETIVNITDSLK